jgi:DNA-binding SARP family transcriptional activator
MAARRVTALLALNDGPPVQRAYVAGRLWFNASEAHAHASLRSALFRLRAACPAAVVESDGEVLCLAKHVGVDIREQVATARRVLAGATAQEDVDCGVLASDLLPDWYDDWVSGERERLRQLRLHALETLSEQFAARHRFAEAVEAALMATGADPLRATACRALITAYRAEGNDADALKAYSAYCELLRRRLGLKPPTELTRMVESISAERPCPRPATHV